MRYIEIYDEHPGGGFFSISSVTFKRQDRLYYGAYEGVELMYVEEDDVFAFLWYFLEKYFDKSLSYNTKREEFEWECIDYFDWYGSNYYTYESIYRMLVDIVEVIWLLEADYDNSQLDELKKNIRSYNVTDEDDPCHWGSDDIEILKNNVDCVIYFYKRFVIRMKQMMENHPTLGVICFEGP